MLSIFRTGHRCRSFPGLWRERYVEHMTFNSNADVSGNKAQRRGRTAAVAGGGLVGLGGLAVIINMLTGGALTAFLGDGTDGSGAGTAEQGTQISECDTGADANENDDCRLAAASLAIDEYWATQVQGYRDPTLVIVDGATSTPCGTASNEAGPFYCPADETVYIDPTFFGILRSQFGAQAGSLAQLYVVAHEYGHHIQQITGIMDQHPNNGTGPDSNGVRTELQADCFAGSWIAAMAEQKDQNGVPFLQPPTEDQIVDALQAAATVGDDHIQQQSGYVNPESWTHGSSEQRQRWFATGYKGGPTSCDTFDVSGANL